MDEQELLARVLKLFSELARLQKDHARKMMDIVLCRVRTPEELRKFIPVTTTLAEEKQTTTTLAEEKLAAAQPQLMKYRTKLEALMSNILQVFFNTQTVRHEQWCEVNMFLEGGAPRYEFSNIADQLNEFCSLSSLSSSLSSPEVKVECIPVSEFENDTFIHGLVKLTFGVPPYALSLDGVCKLETLIEEEGEENFDC